MGSIHAHTKHIWAKTHTVFKVYGQWKSDEEDVYELKEEPGLLRLVIRMTFGERIRMMTF